MKTRKTRRSRRRISCFWFCIRFMQIMKKVLKDFVLYFFVWIFVLCPWLFSRLMPLTSTTSLFSTFCLLLLSHSSQTDVLVSHFQVWRRQRYHCISWVGETFKGFMPNSIIQSLIVITSWLSSGVVDDDGHRRRSVPAELKPNLFWRKCNINDKGTLVLFMSSHPRRGWLDEHSSFWNHQWILQRRQQQLDCISCCYTLETTRDFLVSVLLVKNLGLIFKQKSKFIPHSFPLHSRPKSLICHSHKKTDSKFYSYHFPWNLFWKRRTQEDCFSVCLCNRLVSFSSQGNKSVILQEFSQLFFLQLSSLTISPSHAVDDGGDFCQRRQQLLLWRRFEDIAYEWLWELHLSHYHSFWRQYDISFGSSKR